MGCAPCKSTSVNSITLKPQRSQDLPPHDTQEAIKIDPVQYKLKILSKLSSNYTLGVKLGEGSHGVVRLGTHKSSSQRRAIKSIEKSTLKTEALQLQFMNELEVLRQLDHPNIVQLYEFYEDETYYHLVTEYLPGGELFDYIVSNKHFSEAVVAEFMRQILSAISYIHSKGVVHRDIKPENLLLDRSQDGIIIKVIDFGTAAVKVHKKLHQKCGNAFYVAPEIFSKEGYDEKCDIWSCGAVFYVMLCGRPPFYAKTDEEIIQKVLTGKFSTAGPEWEQISAQAIDLLHKMLELDPKTRISAKDALNHEWFQQSSKDSTSFESNILSLQVLKNFHIENKFQHIVTGFISSNLLSKEEKTSLYLKFKELDKNNDGKLSAEELLAAYSKMMKIEEAEEEVQRIMKSVDSNCSGFIDYSEFCTACSKKDKLINEENLLAAFQAFDADQSGGISVAEVKSVLGVFGSDSQVSAQ